MVDIWDPQNQPQQLFFRNSPLIFLIFPFNVSIFYFNFNDVPPNVPYIPLKLIVGALLGAPQMEASFYHVRAL